MSLEKELRLAPIKPYGVLKKIAGKFDFNTEISENLKDEVEIKIDNFSNQIPAECSLSEEIYDGVPAYFYRYFGAIKNETGEVSQGYFAAHVLQGTNCRGQFVRQIERHGKTPSWFPIED